MLTLALGEILYYASHSRWSTVSTPSDDTFDSWAGGGGVEVCSREKGLERERGSKGGGQ